MTSGTFGVLGKTLTSHTDFDTDEPTRLRILFYKGATWRSLERGNATLLIRTFAPLTELSAEERDGPTMHGLVYVTGKAAHSST